MKQCNAMGAHNHQYSIRFLAYLIYLFNYPVWSIEGLYFNYSDITPERCNWIDCQWFNTINWQKLVVFNQKFYTGNHWTCALYTHKINQLYECTSMIYIFFRFLIVFNYILFIYRYEKLVGFISQRVLNILGNPWWTI